MAQRPRGKHWESEQSWKNQKCNVNILMTEKFVKNMVMNEDFVQNSVMNAKN